MPAPAAGSALTYPTAQGTVREATHAPDPELDPPQASGTSVLHGFVGATMCSFVPHPPRANSTVLTLPRQMAPAAIKFCATGAVAPAT